MHGRMRVRGRLEGMRRCIGEWQEVDVVSVAARAALFVSRYDFMT
jgi:hypothetical protein